MITVQTNTNEFSCKDCEQTDIQVIIDYYLCLEYIAKYASKAEKISSVAREAVTSVLCEPSNQNDTKRALRKFMMRAVGQRDMSIQQVMHHILSIKLISSTFQVITTSLEGSRKVKQSNDGSLLDFLIQDDTADSVLILQETWTNSHHIVRELTISSLYS